MVRKAVDSRNGKEEKEYLASGDHHPACGPPLLVIDAHVHIYPCFDLSGFLDAAFSNGLHAARHFGHDPSYIPVLLLTEGYRQREFHRLRERMEGGNERIADGKNGGYRLFPTEEPESLRIERTDGSFLFLIAGFQIVTSEQLEVLALSTVSEIPDGLPLEKTVAAVEKYRAIPVIPWGFGKWFGRRRHVLTEFLASRREGGFFLGDNGGRPTLLRFPDFGREVPGLSLKVLPGSDALPLPSELKKVGSFGFTLQEEFTLGRPGESLKRILLKRGVEPTPFGSHENLYRFAWNQMNLRIWKHRI